MEYKIIQIISDIMEANCYLINYDNKTVIVDPCVNVNTLKKYDVKGYVSTHGIKIINKNISKVSGIEYVKNIIDIADDNIYTIGDRINDFEMINKYNGYLIGNQVNSFKEFLEKIDN